MLWKPGPGRDTTCPSPSQRGVLHLDAKTDTKPLHVPVNVGYREEGHENGHNFHQDCLGRDWGSCLCSQPCCFTGSGQVRIPEHVRHVCRSGIRPALRDRAPKVCELRALCSHFHRRVDTPSRACGKGHLEIVWSTSPAQSMLRVTSNRIVNISMDGGATIPLGSLFHHPQSKGFLLFKRNFLHLGFVPVASCLVMGCQLPFSTMEKSSLASKGNTARDSGRLGGMNTHGPVPLELLMTRLTLPAACEPL